MAFQAARQLQAWQWLGTPAAVCVAAAVVFAIPVKILGLVSLPEPIWPAAAAFAWAVIRPSVLAPVVLLALGVFLDLLWGAPLGSWPLSLFAGYGLIISSRSMLTGQSLPVLWGWYVVMTVAVMTAAYLLCMLRGASAASLWSVWWQFLPTVLLYPFAHRLIERFEDADVRFR